MAAHFALFWTRSFQSNSISKTESDYEGEGRNSQDFGSQLDWFNLLEFERHEDPPGFKPRKFAPILLAGGKDYHVRRSEY
jgi:hypothetical protein